MCEGDGKGSGWLLDKTLGGKVSVLGEWNIAWGCRAGGIGSPFAVNSAPGGWERVAVGTVPTAAADASAEAGREE